MKEEACLWASSQAAGRDYQHLEMYFKKLIRIWKTVHTHSLWLHPPKSVWQSSEAWLSPGPVQTTIKVLLFDYTKWYLIPQRRWKAITLATYLWTELRSPPHSHLMMQKKYGFCAAFGRTQHITNSPMLVFDFMSISQWNTLTCEITSRKLYFC